MKKIILIVLVILIARSCLSQMANPTQYNEWETSNSYIAGGTAVMLGSMIAIATKSPIEITPQVGPAINWYMPDHSRRSWIGITDTIDKKNPLDSE